ncbi:MAG: hypothetical protein AABZ53_13820 [Planctomycetota bacterium]
MNDHTLEFDAVPELLSPAGRQRREEILGALQQTRGKRRARRMVLRACVALGAVAIAVVLGLRTPGFDTRGVDTPASHNELPQVANDGAPFIRLVGGEPSQARIITNDGPHLIRVLSDDQLLSSLREAGQPDGIAIVGGKFMLASQIVAEDVQTN